MTDRETLMAAILDDPGNDTPRLAFADHCEEIGDKDRCEHIRIQIELAKRCTPRQLENLDCIDMYIDPQDEDRQEWKRGILPLYRRADELREGVVGRGDVEKWFPGWGGWKICTNVVAGTMLSTKAAFVSRGFISAITRCSWEDFLGHERAALWSPGMTDECPKCEGTGEYSATGREMDAGRCRKCKSGRISRPFHAAAQPLVEVRLTDIPVRPELARLLPGAMAFTLPTIVGKPAQFRRVKCRFCNGTGAHRYHDFPDGKPNYSDSLPCRECAGGSRRLNEWTCDRWGCAFEMPPALMG